MRPSRTSPGTDTDAAAQRLDRAIDLAITSGLVVLVLVGFAASYRTLRDLAAAAGGYPAWLAPAIPLSFDLGIVVLSLKVARAAREGRTAPVLRLLVAALSTATLAANAAAATTPAARLLHAVPPAMASPPEGTAPRPLRRAVRPPGLTSAPSRVTVSRPTFPSSPCEDACTTTGCSWRSAWRARCASG